jgi:hypothetical protein
MSRTYGENIMFDHLDNINSQEHLKDLYREAANERLARSVTNENNVLNTARKVLGENLVKIGQQLLNDKQR